MKNIFGNQSEMFLVTDSTLSFEEPADAYVIRDEVVLEDNQEDNGMIQIVTDGYRAAKDDAVYRYYSESEDEILAQIGTLDEQINNEIEQSGLKLVSSDIYSLESQIESEISDVYKLNDIKMIEEVEATLNSYMAKKTQLTGEISPENSNIRTLTDARNNLARQLEANSKIVYATRSGLISYRVDGLEDTLKVDNFDYLTEDLLEGFELKAGASVPLSTEKAKIINNFNCYIAVISDSEMAFSAKEGDKVVLRISNADEVDAEIVYTKEENSKKIIVFRIDRDVEKLIQYRKVSIDVIWWRYSGLKVSNDALTEENDVSYVERERAGNIEKIYVKILRQNETYSIVENYDDEELRSLGYSEDYISNRSKIKIYDEILLH
jgi:cob(I)alamin adenosyltransferase